MKIEKNSRAFTIVELLVVIVVIGILAAITIVSYSGISNKAIVANLQNDLDSDAKLLKLYNVEYGYYPSAIDSITHCPTLPTADTRYCLRSMTGATLNYTGGGQSFKLIDTHINTNIAYKITEDGTSEVYAPGPWKQIGAGYHNCAITTSGKAYCWGSNLNGQLGDNTTTNRYAPTAVYTAGALNGLTIKKIVAGWNSTCAIASNDQVYCWGYNGSYQLGDGTSTQRIAPVPITTTGDLSGLSIKDIAMGTSHTCVIASDNNVYCWGVNGSGQVGNNSTSNVPIAKAVIKTGVLNGLTIKKITAGANHTCAIASDNNAYCWGQDTYGQLGDGTNTESHIPVAVYKTGQLNSLTIKQISAGESGYHTCALASDNNAYCWGSNTFGQLGDNTTVDKNVPTIVYNSGSLNGLTISNLGAGSHTTCAVASNYQVYCWGDNSDGQVGDNSTTQRKVPTATSTAGVLSGVRMDSISMGYEYSCAISQNTYAYCWGWNTPGGLGDTTTTNRLTPTQLTSF